MLRMLLLCIVFTCFSCEVARALHDIPEWWGTAVNVQAMVFGNMGNDCATGVAFTRDPSTGTNEFYGRLAGVVVLHPPRRYPDMNQPSI